MSKMELRLTGSGGQGVILATVILAEAAILAGKHTAQSQAYGPEARGGSCKAETLISDTPIGYTKVQKPDLLLTLTQESFEKYIKETPEDCIVVADSSLNIPEEMKTDHILSLPILRTAEEKIGRLQTANIVAVGCINELLKIAEPSVMEHAVKMHVPKGTEALNFKALEEGAKLAQTQRSPQKPEKDTVKTQKGKTK